MAWWDSLIDFGTKNADWLAPVAGAAAGALSGGKSQTTTQNSAPVLPENVKSGYDKLISDAMTAYGRPFDARPTKRVETGGNAFQQLFQNPELQMIQQQADAAYQQPQMMPQAQPEQPMTAQPMAAPQEPVVPAGYGSPEEQMLERLRMYAQGYDHMSGKKDPNAEIAKRLLAHYNNTKDIPDGTVNKYTGVAYSKAEQDAEKLRQLSNMALGKNEGLFSQANREMTQEQRDQMDKLWASTYAPSKSKSGFIHKALNVAKPLLVGAVLGPGAAGALGGLGVGGTAASLGSKGFSALVNQGLK